MRIKKNSKIHYKQHNYYIIYNNYELINIFDKVGGVLTCDYDKNKALLEKTYTNCDININCDIKHNDYKEFESLYHLYGLGPIEIKDLTYDKNNKKTLDKIIKNDIQIKNKYLTNDNYGFKIYFTD